MGDEEGHPGKRGPYRVCLQHNKGGWMNMRKAIGKGKKAKEACCRVDSTIEVGE